MVETSYQRRYQVKYGVQATLTESTFYSVLLSIPTLRSFR